MNKIIGIGCVDTLGHYAPINGGPLPWPKEEGDLDWFKFVTNGGILVVGSRSYEELQKLPALKNREVWPVGSKHELKSTKDVLAKFSNEGNGRNLFIGGGNKLWEEFAPLYDVFYLTVLKKEYLAQGEGIQINFILPKCTCIITKPHYNVILGMQGEGEKILDIVSSES